MKLSNFVCGLEILRRYFKDPDGYHLGGEHDVIYVYATDSPVNSEDLQKLVALGWLQEGSDFAEGDVASEYQPNESWYVFT